jgi:hypothetical protein
MSSHAVLRVVDELQANRVWRTASVRARSDETPAIWRNVPLLPALLAGTRTSVAGRSTTLSTTRLLRVRAKTRAAEQLPRHGTGCIRPFLEPLPFGDEVIRSGVRGIVTGSEFQWLRARQDAK